MRQRWAIAAIVLLVAVRAVTAEEYRVEAIKEAPSGLAAEIADQLAPGGIKVVDDNKRTVCEIWLAKTWTAKPDFQPSDTVLYPLEPGSLVGALRFTRKGADFRGQDIPAGVYTLRYANQPVDGNHVGTFATRDFLVLVPARADESAKPIGDAELFPLSAQSAESSHPAIAPLVKPEAGPAPAMRDVEEQHWWTVRVAGQDDKGNKIPMELIVVGKAAE